MAAFCNYILTTFANKSYFLLLLLQLLVSCLIIIARNSLQSFLEMENVLGRHLECRPLDLTQVLFSIQISSGYV